MVKAIAKDHNRIDQHDGPTNKSFGLTVGGILIGLGALRYYWHGEFTVLTYILLVVGVPLVLTAVLFPQILTPLNKAWMALGLLLGKIVNPIVMLLVFCVTIIPTSLVLRIRGYDPLKLRVKPNTNSHWIERDPAGPDPEDMINQF